MFLHCENTRCKYYYEDSCMRDMGGMMVCLDCFGKCEDFEEGVNEAYKMEVPK